MTQGDKALDPIFFVSMLHHAIRFVDEYALQTIK